MAQRSIVHVYVRTYAQYTDAVYIICAILPPYTYVRIFVAVDRPTCNGHNEQPSCVCKYDVHKSDTRRGTYTDGPRQTSWATQCSKLIEPIEPRPKRVYSGVPLRANKYIQVNKANNDKEDKNHVLCAHCGIVIQSNIDSIQMK